MRRLAVSDSDSEETKIKGSASVPQLQSSDCSWTRIQRSAEGKPSQAMSSLWQSLYRKQLWTFETVLYIDIVPCTCPFENRALELISCMLTVVYSTGFGARFPTTTTGVTKSVWVLQLSWTFPTWSTLPPRSLSSPLEQMRFLSLRLCQVGKRKTRKQKKILSNHWVSRMYSNEVTAWTTGGVILL